jgi:hypothetical protein
MAAALSSLKDFVPRAVLMMVETNLQEIEEQMSDDLTQIDVSIDTSSADDSVAQVCGLLPTPVMQVRWCPRSCIPRVSSMFT